MEPITRQEMFLAKAGGQAVNPIEPITREEMFLAKLAGQDVSTPEPHTRKEMLLKAACDNAGGGGGGGTGGGGAEIKTCNVTFNTGEWSFGDVEIVDIICTQLVDGKVKTTYMGELNGEEPLATLTGEPFVLENVVCGTCFIFNLGFSGNGHEVIFDEGCVTNFNDDYERGQWAISPDATSVEFTINKSW